MKQILALLIVVCAFNSYAEDKPILVSTQWVKEHLKDPNLVLLQVTYLKLDFDREHIEGAQYLWPESLAPNSPNGSYNAPDTEKATELLRNYGVNENSHIVVYHVRGEVSPTARMFLTLEHFGLKGKVSFMNGGLDAWKKEGFPVTNVLTAPKKGNIKLQPVNLLVDKDYVLKTLESDKAYVVDARHKSYYDGETTGNPRDGHITGAKNIAFMDLIDSNTNQFKSVGELKGYFEPVASPDKELVTYCFIGQTASVVYMAGRMLGYNMKLYDGSMQEWSRIESLPMEKTPKTP
jgi:thiosulfate/3-mercaptopyruvate sulfurtransferase